MRLLAFTAVILLGGSHSTVTGYPSHLNEWLALTGHPHATADAAETTKLRRAASVRVGTRVVLIRVYKLAEAYGRQTEARAVVVETPEPALYLLRMLPLMAAVGRPSYVQVLDTHRRTVLEWYGSRGRAGFYVRPDLQGCSPATALGWWSVPPCPAS